MYRPSRQALLRPVGLTLALTLGTAACAASGDPVDDVAVDAVAVETPTPIPEPTATETPDDLAFVDPAVDATSFSLVVDPNGAILRGKVPDDEARLLLVSAATSGFVGGTIIDELTVAGVTMSDAARSNVTAAADLILPVSGNLRLGLMRLDGAYVRIEGNAYDRPAAVALDAGLRETGLENGLSVSIPEPGTESALQTAINELDLQSIQFETGTADLTPAAETVLNDVAILLNDNPRVRVQVEGHTDGRGSQEDNIVLSQERAEAVVAALGALGVDTSRLGARGFGEERPIADDSTPEGQAQNRRVELIVQEN